MTQEQSQALAEGTKAALATAKGYADIILKPPLEQIGGILSDTIGLWRLKNQVNVMLKAKKFLEAKGVSNPTKLQPDIFVPLLEQASYTEDETLSDMFARLLAANADAERSSEVHPSFAKVLGQLSSVDARVLLIMDEIDSKETPNSRRIRSERRTTLEVLQRLKAYDESLFSLFPLAMSNLYRLGFYRWDGNYFGYYVMGNEQAKGWYLTRYANIFLTGCDGNDYWRRGVIYEEPFNP